MAITTDRDRVRLLTGDTDSADPLLQDDEVDHFLTDQGAVYPAAAAAALAIAAKFARGFNFSTDGQSFNRSERVAHYTALAESLLKKAGVSTAATTRKDAYSDDIAYDDVEPSTTTGRVRAGYFEPDLPM